MQNDTMSKFRDVTVPGYTIDQLLDALVRLSETRASARDAGNTFAAADRSAKIAIIRAEIARRAA